MYILDYNFLGCDDAYVIYKKKYSTKIYPRHCCHFYLEVIKKGILQIIQISNIFQALEAMVRGIPPLFFELRELRELRLQGFFRAHRRHTWAKGMGESQGSSLDTKGSFTAWW